MPRDRASDPPEPDPPSRAGTGDRAPAKSPADPVLVLVAELRCQSEEVGRLRERLAAAERRARAAEAAARDAERARREEAALADAFVDLLEAKLREARRRLREFERWLEARPPRRR